MSCSRGRWCRRCPTKRPRSSGATSIRCASSAGRYRTPIPGSRGSRPRRGRQGAAQGARPGRPAAQGRGRDVGTGERVARSLPRAARCGQRGGFLQHLRQHVLAPRSAQRHDAEERAAPGAADSRELPYVKEALASIREGGYTEAFARVAFLMARKDEPLPLSRVRHAAGPGQGLRGPASRAAAREWRRIRGEQEIIARYEPEQAIDTLAVLLADRADRERLLHAARARAGRQARAAVEADRRADGDARAHPRRCSDSAGSRPARRRANAAPTVARPDTPIRPISCSPAARALVVGIANEHSIAYGCAEAFRELGADLAITYLNEKARPHVEPLARELEAPIFLPLDVSVPGELEAVFERIAQAVGPARRAGAFHRLGAEGRPAGRAPRLLGRGLRESDGHLLPFVHPHGAARRAADDRRRHDVRDELPRRAEGRAELQRDGARQGGAGSLRAAISPPSWGRRSIRVHAISPGPLKTRAASGLKDFDLLLNEAGQRAPVGELVDIMDVGVRLRVSGDPVRAAHDRANALCRRRREHHGLSMEPTTGSSGRTGIRRAAISRRCA